MRYFAPKHIEAAVARIASGISCDLAHDPKHATDEPFTFATFAPLIDFQDLKVRHWLAPVGAALCWPLALFGHPAVLWLRAKNLQIAKICLDWLKTSRSRKSSAKLLRLNRYHKTKPWMQWCTALGQATSYLTLVSLSPSSKITSHTLEDTWRFSSTSVQVQKHSNPTASNSLIKCIEWSTW